MRLNAAGLNVAGQNNPNWKGGSISKVCEICAANYTVKRPQAASRYCSLQCVGVSQRGKSRFTSPNKGLTLGVSRKVEKRCDVCEQPFLVFPAHVNRQHCCGRACSFIRRSRVTSGAANSNWNGGLSRLPYPWNFKQISRSIIERDGGKCQSPECAGTDPRMTSHHINYDKSDCAPENLIALCSACNSKANFGRERWQATYQQIMRSRNLVCEEFS